jgi:tetratricopeptide (TPR) repeat protein
VQACEATAIHRTQSEALLDKRMSCLDHSLVELDVTLETLAATDRDRVRHALDLATALPSPARCADPDRLVAVPPPEKATQIAAVSRNVERARALLHVAAVDKAAELAGQAVAAAEALQYPPLLAEAYDIRGQANLPLGNPQLTRESFEKAVLAAATARDLELEARSLANLALVLRNTSADGKVAIEHAKHALAVAQRAKRDPALEAQIRYVLISVLAGIDLPAVMEHFTKGRELLALPSGRDTRTLKLDYDVIEAKLDINPNSAIEKYQKALLLAEEVYGNDHPQVAAILVEMANMGVVAERYDEVRAWSKRIAQILEPYPGDRVELRRIDAALERDPKKRRAILEEVVRLSEAAGGARSMQLAMDREKLAETLLELEAWKDGLAQIDAAIATWEALYGGQFELMITSLVTKAQLHAGLEQWDEVAKAAERANSIVDKGGMRELVKVMARLLLMDSYFRQKRYEEALALIEQAAPTIRLALFGDPVTKLLDFYAAACNWELGRDRRGSLKKAKDALAIIKTSELADDATLAPLRAWLRGK